MTANDENRWYFTKEQLENSPSQHCGMDADKELSQRQQAANFIQDMGQRLQVTQLCINTAIVYMHRFYCYHSFTLFHRNAIAAAAIFLAAKVEEQPRKLEHIIRVTQMLLQRNQAQLDRRSEAYLEQAQELVMNENILLMTLGFDVAIEHPHAFIVKFCHIINASKDLSQTSYFMASNSLHLTTMCLQYKPTVVACFCIHLVCKWSNCQIPRSSENLPWYAYIDNTVTEELLEQLTSEFLVIFDKCPSRLKKKIQNSQVSCQNSLSNYSFEVDSRNSRQQLNSTGQLAQSTSSNTTGLTAGSSSSQQPQHQHHNHHHHHHHHHQQQHRQQQSSQQPSTQSQITQLKTSDISIQQQHTTLYKTGHSSDTKKTATGIGHSSTARHQFHSTSSAKGNSSSSVVHHSSSVNGISERNATASSHKLPNSSNSVIPPQPAVRANNAVHIPTTVPQTTSQQFTSFGLSSHKGSVSATTSAKSTRSVGGLASHNAITKDTSSSLSSSAIHRLEQPKKPIEANVETSLMTAVCSSTTMTSCTTANMVASSYGLPNGHHSRSISATSSLSFSNGSVASSLVASSAKKENGLSQESVFGSSRSATFTPISQSDIISYVVKEVALAKQNEKQECDKQSNAVNVKNEFDKKENASVAFSKGHSIFSPSPVGTKTSPYEGDRTLAGGASSNSVEADLVTVMKRVDSVSGYNNILENNLVSSSSCSSFTEREMKSNQSMKPIASSNIVAFTAPLKNVERSSPNDSSEQSRGAVTVLDGNTGKANTPLPHTTGSEFVAHVHKKKKKHKEKDKKHDKEKHHRHREKKRHKDDKHRKERNDKEIHNRAPEPLKITIPKEKLQFDIPVKPHSTSSLVIAPVHFGHQSESDGPVKLKIKLPKNKSYSVAAASDVVMGSGDGSNNNSETEPFPSTSRTGTMGHVSTLPDCKLRISKEKLKSRKRHRDSDQEDVSKKHAHYASDPRNGFSRD